MKKWHSIYLWMAIMNAPALAGQCDDPAIYLGQGLKSIGQCAKGPVLTDLMEQSQRDEALGLVCLSAPEELAAYCRDQDRQMKVLSRNPVPQIHKSAGILASFAYSLMVIPDLNDSPLVDLSVEAMEGLWGKAGLMPTMMSGRAYEQFAATRMDGEHLNAEMIQAVRSGVELIPSLMDEKASVNDGRWSYSVLVLLDKRILRNSFAPQEKAIRISMSGQFDGRVATDANILGLMVDQWQETTVPRPLPQIKKAKNVRQ